MRNSLMRRGLVGIVLAGLIGWTTVGALFPESAAAVAPGACGSILLAGGSWLNGGGVDVRSNGANQGTGNSCGGTSVVNGTTAGSQYQCVELVNRLYLTKGWISSTWHGNGGRSSAAARDSMYDEAPAGLSKQPNGSIASVSPGDVVSINEYLNGAFLADGHVLVVNTGGTVTSGSVPLVSENGGSASSATVTRTANLGGGTLTLASSGSYSYEVIGVVHAPTSSPPPPPASHAPSDVNGDGRSDLVILTGENGATTGTAKLELHALDAATGFATRLIDAGTKYGYIDTRHVIPLMGDQNGDGRSDLCILTGVNGQATGTGKLEIHCADGASGYAGTLTDLGTKYDYINTDSAIPTLADVNGDGRADLCLITGINGHATGTGKLEVHCANAATGYSTSAADAGTPFGYINTQHVIPVMADQNGDGRADLCILTGVNGQTTGTRKLEIHCADAASGFSTRFADLGTKYDYINTDSAVPMLADINGDGRADLCLVTGINGHTTGTGKLEVHCANAATGYSTSLADVGTQYAYIDTAHVTVGQTSMQQLTVPMAPAIVRVTTHSGRASIGLAAPINDGGWPITSYVVTSSPGNKSVTVPASQLTATVAGLTNGKTYTFTATAVSAVGRGTVSAPSRAVTIVGAPAAPTKVKATRASGRALKVTFTAPANNGAKITRYTARCTSPKGGATNTKSRSASPITVTGLTHAKKYTCTVTATNSHGVGPASKPSKAVKV